MVDTTLVSNWNLLLKTLDESVRTTFLNSIKYHIESNDSEVVSNVGYLYDSILIKEGVFLNEAGRFISTVIMRVLKSDKSIELQWLKNLILKQPEILKKDKHANNAFFREIESLNVENYTPEAQSEIREIAKELGVPIQANLEEGDEDNGE